MSLASLTNCVRCEKAFNDYSGRSVCAACRGKKAFGTALETPKCAEPAQPLLRATPLIRETVHALRCDIRAQQARAHEPSIQIGHGIYM